jgi:hypothetical protein
MRHIRLLPALALVSVAWLAIAPAVITTAPPILGDRPIPTGRLLVQAYHPDGTLFAERRLHNTITTVGKTALRDCFGGTGSPTCTPIMAYKYHGLGTGATGGAGATGCTTELTTAYNPDNTRATGSQTNNGANIYRTVGTNTVDASAAITEFCLMSQAATGGGSIWSTVGFSAINLTSGDSLQTTYDGTFN